MKKIVGNNQYVFLFSLHLKGSCYSRQKLLGVNQGRLKVHERILVILAAQPGPNGQLSCLHSFKIF